VDLDQYVHRLEIRCLHAVQEMLAGEYLSVFKGRGIEFEDVRPYQPGDEIRSIDWNVTARTGQPFIKRFVEERDLTVYVLVDISASGDFGSRPQTKREAAAEIAGLLAFSAAVNHDRTGLMLFTDEVERYLQPAKGRSHVTQLLHEILSHEAKSPKTSLAAPLEMLLHLARRRAVVFLISDFQDQGYEDLLQAASQVHDLVAISIADRNELELPSIGLVRLKDAETGRFRLLDTDSPKVREAYRAAALRRHETLENLLDENGIDHFRLQAGEDYAGALHGFLRARIASRRGNHHG